jgi:outer membrane protein OmpA-like peptidoglycan-associated protein
MRIQVFLLFFLLHISFIAFPQSKSKQLTGKPVSSDCPMAIPININTSTTYGPTISPSGYGKTQEIKEGSRFLFDGEHNTAWYLLTISRDGELIFEIQPQDTTNDYDFLLYSYSDSNFCDLLIKNKLIPLRSNLSNITRSHKGVTGLKSNEINMTVGKGLGNANSGSLMVKKNERYMLILDNVTAEGKGHTIYFNFLKNVEISGNVINSDNVPVEAEITLSDNKGATVIEARSDKNGNYKIKAGLKENLNYNLSILSDSTFVQSQTINTIELKGKVAFSDIKVVLPKLKKGEKYKLGSINFYGNVAMLLPESFASVESLFKLMKKNKKMIIQIEGHVNDPGNMSDKGFDQTLSNERAKTIYNYLVKKGISKDRISFVGLSNNFPLYKKPANEFQAQANRRVEIKVISIE